MRRISSGEEGKGAEIFWEENQGWKKNEDGEENQFVVTLNTHEKIFSKRVNLVGSRGSGQPGHPVSTKR